MVVVFSSQVWDKPLLGFSLSFFGFAKARLCSNTCSFSYSAYLVQRCVRALHAWQGNGGRKTNPSWNMLHPVCYFCKIAGSDCSLSLFPPLLWQVVQESLPWPVLSQLPCSWEPSHSQMDKTLLQGGTAAPSGFPTASLGGTHEILTSTQPVTSCFSGPPRVWIARFSRSPGSSSILWIPCCPRMI